MLKNSENAPIKKLRYLAAGASSKPLEVKGAVEKWI
jgi:hypothetical protein